MSLCFGSIELHFLSQITKIYFYHLNYSILFLFLLYLLVKRGEHYLSFSRKQENIFFLVSKKKKKCDDIFNVF